jgi:hypothetical protein
MGEDPLRHPAAGAGVGVGLGDERGVGGAAQDRVVVARGGAQLAVGRVAADVRAGEGEGLERPAEAARLVDLRHPLRPIVDQRQVVRAVDLPVRVAARVVGQVGDRAVAGRLLLGMVLPAQEPAVVVGEGSRLGDPRAGRRHRGEAVADVVAVGRRDGGPPGARGLGHRGQPPLPVVGLGRRRDELGDRTPRERLPHPHRARHRTHPCVAHRDVVEEPVAANRVRRAYDPRTAERVVVEVLRLLDRVAHLELGDRGPVAGPVVERLPHVPEVGKEASLPPHPPETVEEDLPVRLAGGHVDHRRHPRRRPGVGVIGP